MENLANKSSDDLSQMLADKETELQEMSKNLSVLDETIGGFEKQILDLRSKKKDLDIAAGKGRHNLRILHSEKRLLENLFWRSKGR